MHMPETRKIIEKYRNQRNEIKNKLHLDIQRINREHTKKVRELRSGFRRCYEIIEKATSYGKSL